MAVIVAIVGDFCFFCGLYLPLLSRVGSEAAREPLLLIFSPCRNGKRSNERVSRQFGGKGNLHDKRYFDK